MPTDSVLTDLLPALRIAIKEKRTWREKSNIYLVNDEVIGKQYRHSKDSKGCAINEYKWGNFLFKNGVQVPEMYQLVSPDPPSYRSLHETPIEDWFVLMQKIDGEEIWDLKGDELEEAIRQYRREIEKVLAFRVYPADSHYGGNSMFDRKQRKLYLIDLELWKEGTDYMIDEFHEGIEEILKTFRRISNGEIDKF
jgi:hypothetical protein